jgi:hypothetical protein
LNFKSKSSGVDDTCNNINIIEEEEDKWDDLEPTPRTDNAKLNAEISVEDFNACWNDDSVLKDLYRGESFDK